MKSLINKIKTFVEDNIAAYEVELFRKTYIPGQLVECYHVIEEDGLEYDYMYNNEWLAAFSNQNRFRGVMIPHVFIWDKPMIMLPDEKDWLTLPEHVRTFIFEHEKGHIKLKHWENYNPTNPDYWDMPSRDINMELEADWEACRAMGVMEGDPLCFTAINDFIDILLDRGIDANELIERMNLLVLRSMENDHEIIINGLNKLLNNHI